MNFEVDKFQRNTCESNIIHYYCSLNNYKIAYVNEPTKSEAIHYGSVEFMNKFFSFFDKKFTPNYYPEFLNKFISRKIWKTNNFPVEKCFVKPADGYKIFTGGISDKIKLTIKNYNGSYYCSDIVNFIDEWRAYVVNGKIIGQYFYTDNENKPPILDIKFPDKYCGAIDFGILDNGRIELIEAHHPFSIGWYGGFSKYKEYITFLIEAQRYLLNYE